MIACRYQIKEYLMMEKLCNIILFTTLIYGIASLAMATEQDSSNFLMPKYLCDIFSVIIVFLNDYTDRCYPKLPNSKL